eukprot:1158140-Pelagomonas_calceolata.AAC.6
MDWYSDPAVWVVADGSIPVCVKYYLGAPMLAVDCMDEAGIDACLSLVLNPDAHSNLKNHPGAGLPASS